VFGVIRMLIDRYWFYAPCYSSSIVNTHSPHLAQPPPSLLPVTMEARTCRPDIAVGATVILDTYWSRGAAVVRRSIADEISTCSTTYWPRTRHNRQARRRRPQHVDCARAEHAHRDAEPETQRRSSKSAEINDRDRFKRHARVPGVSRIRMLDVSRTGGRDTPDWAVSIAISTRSIHQQLVSGPRRFSHTSPRKTRHRATIVLPLSVCVCATLMR